MISPLRLVLGIEEIRESLAAQMEISDTHLMKTLRLCHNKDNFQNWYINICILLFKINHFRLAPLRSQIFGTEPLGENSQSDATEFLNSFLQNEEISQALGKTDFMTAYQSSVVEVDLFSSLIIFLKGKVAVWLEVKIVLNMNSL